MAGTALILYALLAVFPVGAIANSQVESPASSSLPIVPYTGSLTDSGGNPINGSHTIRFSLWNLPTGGTMLWPLSGTPESHTVNVQNGQVHLNLGSTAGNGIPATLGGQDLWLQIQVGNEILQPRQQIGAAFNAIDSINAQNVPDASINSRKMAPQWYSAHNPATVSTTSTTQVPTGVSLNFTCDIDCVVLIVHRGLIASSVEHGRVNVDISVDGQPVFREYGLSGVPGGDQQRRFGSVSGSRMINLDAGTHMVSVSFACSASSPGTCEYYGDASGGWEELSVLLFAQTP